MSAMNRGLPRQRDAEGGFAAGGAGVGEAEGTALSGAGGIVSGEEGETAAKGACAALPDARIVGKSLPMSGSA